MDLEKWLIIPNDVFLDIHDDDDDDDDDGGKKIGGDPKIIYHMNYFMCPSPNSQTIPKNPRVENPIFPVPVEFGQVKEIKKVPIDLTMVENEEVKELASKTGDVWDIDKPDQQTVSQVFFDRRLKGNEFTDTKSPVVGELRENLLEKKRLELDSKGEVNWEVKNGGLNVWKWGLSGIGAICSFGVAAATICIVIFGNGIHKQQNQRLRFQIHADEKRFKQAVHHATKLNKAMSAVRGVPLTRAHITFGGYSEDGL